MLQRSLDIGTVMIDGELVQKTSEEIFSLYGQYENDPIELRKMFAPEDEFSNGECFVRETIVRIHSHIPLTFTHSTHIHTATMTK